MYDLILFLMDFIATVQFLRVISFNKQTIGTGWKKIFQLKSIRWFL